MKTISATLVAAALFGVSGYLWVSRNPSVPAQTGCACTASLFTPATVTTDVPSSLPSPSPAATAPVPRLVDLGAGRCVPCKMMAPILDELKKEYAGRMKVDFIDVWQNPEAGKEYAIKMIPTQIFLDAAGKELFRHEGYISKDDILGKWKELGVNFGSQSAAGATEAPKASH